MHIAALAASLAVLKKKRTNFKNSRKYSGTGGEGVAGRKEGGW